MAASVQRTRQGPRKPSSLLSCFTIDTARGIRTLLKSPPAHTIGDVDPHQRRPQHRASEDEQVRGLYASFESIENALPDSNFFSRSGSVFPSPAAAAGWRDFWPSPEFGNSISVDQGTPLLFQANPEHLDRYEACSGRRPRSAWVSSECRRFVNAVWQIWTARLQTRKNKYREDDVPLVEFDGLPAPKPFINCQIPKPSDDRRRSKIDHLSLEFRGMESQSQSQGLGRRLANASSSEVIFSDVGLVFRSLT